MKFLVAFIFQALSNHLAVNSLAKNEDFAEIILD